MSNFDLPGNAIGTLFGYCRLIIKQFFMKSMFKTAIIAVVFSTFLSGCVVVVPKAKPPHGVKQAPPAKSSPGRSGEAPGQVKKKTGSQSAKPYAPGQKKKNK